MQRINKRRNMLQKHVYTAGGERIEQFTDRTAQSGGNGGLVRMLYVHEDIVGNTMYYTKATGQTFSELRYDVWGFPDLSGKLQNNDNGNFVAANFTGHTYDTVLDIYFAEARFYDANNRTFMSTDPVKDGLNWYKYAGNNPTTFFDPTGLYGVQDSNPSSILGQSDTGLGYAAAQSNSYSVSVQISYSATHISNLPRESIIIPQYTPIAYTNQFEGSIAKRLPSYKPLKMGNQLIPYSYFEKITCKVVIKELAQQSDSGIDLIQNLMSRVPITNSKGVTIAGSPSFWNFYASAMISIDNSGNIALQWGYGTGMTTGTPSAGLSFFQTISNAPNVTKLTNEGYAVGGSLAALGGVGGEINIIPDKETNGVYYGVTASAGFGAGAEAHVSGGQTNTFSVLKKPLQVNIFNEWDKVYDLVMGW